ncbi:MAG: TonB-dependent receptor, partial [Sediminibacterium sp.]|nr:TonB-dependent receptor [Sediminibacterium sp.]
KISDKFAYKIGAQYIQIIDWLASDERDYDRTNITNENPFGKIINKQDRNSDLNYDGINVYGDETKVQLKTIIDNLPTSIKSLLSIPANTFPGVNRAIPIPTSILNSIQTQYISRTGFAEKNLVNPISSNFKFNLGLHYKLSPNTELSYNGYYGSGNAVYTGADRYVLKNFSIQQHKLELKNSNWYVRAYITTEDAGNTYNATAAGRLLNEAIKSSYDAKDVLNSWYGTVLYNGVLPIANYGGTAYGNYLGSAFQSATIAFATSAGGQAAGASAYAAALYAGKSQAEAFAAAQAAAQQYGVVNGGIPSLSNPDVLNMALKYAQTQVANFSATNLNTLVNNAIKIADAGRPMGSVINDPRFQKIINTPISNGGAGLIDKSNLIVLDGQYNLSEKLNLKKHGLDWLVGGTFKQYSLKSGNTIFADSAGLNINEYGAYTQISKSFFDDALKIAASGRFDNQTNFDGRFTPRVSAVIKLAQDQHLRLSYQTAYRFPTNQDQYIDLAAGSGILLGGVQSLKDKYKFSTNTVYTQESFSAFAYSALAGAPNPTLLKPQTFNKFQPESNTSFEIGYKGLFDKKILVDFYYYVGEYNNLLTRTNVFQ